MMTANKVKLFLLILQFIVHCVQQVFPLEVCFNDNEQHQKTFLRMIDDGQNLPLEPVHKLNGKIFFLDPEDDMYFVVEKNIKGHKFQLANNINVQMKP